MIGAIRRRDILAHPFVTIHCFGWRVFLRALVANHNQTFLSLLAEAHALEPPAIKVPELVGRCIELEKRAKSIYERLAVWFMGRGPVKEFFEDLAQQEQTHAELLELCRTSASREAWLEEHFGPWRDSVPRLERQMDNIESSLESVVGVTDALRLVLWIERSEINKVFRGVVTATGSTFVRKLSAFQAAGERHITFICEEIPRLDSDLAEECQDLKDRFLADMAGHLESDVMSR
jgi:hypothetical protein